MKKFLISLEQDKRRREVFFAQPNTADFEVFNAINLLNQSAVDFSTIFALDKFWQRYQREASGGEMGCTLSHLALYQKIQQDQTIQADEWVLICEDDALFAKDFQPTLAQLLKQPVMADMILVGQSKIKQFNDRELEINYPVSFKACCKPIEQSQYRYAYPYRNYFAGTVAYLIKKSAAALILQQTEQQLPYWLADDYPWFEQQCGLNIVVVRPLLCIENPCLASNLAAARPELSHHWLKKLIKYPLKKALAWQRNRGK